MEECDTFAEVQGKTQVLAIASVLNAIALGYIIQDNCTPFGIFANTCSFRQTAGDLH